MGECANEQVDEQVSEHMSGTNDTAAARLSSRTSSAVSSRMSSSSAAMLPISDGRPPRKPGLGPSTSFPSFSSKPNDAGTGPLSLFFWSATLNNLLHSPISLGIEPD